MSRYVTFESSSSELSAILQPPLYLEPNSSVGIVDFSFPIHYLVNLGTITVVVDGKSTAVSINIPDKSNGETLSRIINDAFNKYGLPTRGIVKCSFSESARRLDFSSTKTDLLNKDNALRSDPRRIAVSFDEAFFKFLGLKENKTHIDGFRAYLHFDWSIVKNFYIHCNVISEQNIANNKHDVLQIVSPIGALYEYKYLHFDSPHFVKSNKTIIHTINIRITDSKNNLIDFIRGPIILKLLFKNADNSLNKRRQPRHLSSKYSNKVYKCIQARTRSLRRAV